MSRVCHVKHFPGRSLRSSTILLTEKTQIKGYPSTKSRIQKAWV